MNDSVSRLKLLLSSGITSEAAIAIALGVTRADDAAGSAAEQLLACYERTIRQVNADLLRRRISGLPANIPANSSTI